MLLILGDTSGPRHRDGYGVRRWTMGQWQADEKEFAMKRRFALRFGLPFVGLLLLAFSWAWYTSPRHNITVATCLQLKEGMNEDEIVALLGIKAGDYSGMACVHSLKIKIALVLMP